MPTEATTYRGKIKTANSSGFGFIETELGIDFFFHFTAFKGNWKQMLSRFVNKETLLVEFENDSKSTTGPRASNVRIVTSIPQDGE